MSRWRAIGRHWVAGLPRNERATAGVDGYVQPGVGSHPAAPPPKQKPNPRARPKELPRLRCPECRQQAPFNPHSGKLHRHNRADESRCANRKPPKQQDRQQDRQPGQNRTRPGWDAQGARTATCPSCGARDVRVVGWEEIEQHDTPGEDRCGQTRRFLSRTPPERPDATH